MTAVKELRKKWLRDPDVRAAYDALEEEFSLAGALIDARARSKLTQAQVADRMDTTQAYVAKMEGQKVNPSVATLRRFAEATGTRLKISFEPK